MSRIEQIIEEMEEYLEGCKAQMFSNRIVVDKETMMELLAELRLRTPDEIKKYQKIVANRDAILDEARRKAEDIVNQANIQTNELINEHEIMQQAYAKANAIIQQANEEARTVINQATEYANDYRMGAIRYTDDLLTGMQNLVAATMEGTKAQYEKFFKSLSDTYDIISSNRNELYPDTEASVEYVADTDEFEDEE
ncbi:MAG: vacuolar family H+-ATPase subunit H [Lachnospiraceae bacterium]|nr:vacuolar family H+-ATPase subunit H [Lachnospiraceae bacterium]